MVTSPNSPLLLSVSLSVPICLSLSSTLSELITMERFLLKELGFSFYNPIEHPHKYLLYYIKVLLLLTAPAPP
jgi:hypothetical protein